MPSCPSCRSLAILSLLASGAGAQALSFGDLDWAQQGSHSGPSSVNDSLMHVEGPDGACTGSAVFVATAPISGTVRVQLNFRNEDEACHYDWPLYVIDGVETLVYYVGGDDCWFSGPIDVMFEVSAGQEFGLGVGSADCFLGPGVADYREFTLLPDDPWDDLGGALDPRLVARVAAPVSADDFARALSSVGDTDADGYADVAAALASPAGVALHSGADGQLLWVAPAPTAPGETALALAAPGDLDGDGVPDVAVGSHLVAGVVALSGADGSTLWSWSGAPGSAAGRRLVAFGDRDGDGVTDLAAASGELPGQPVVVISGAGGATLATLPPGPSDVEFGVAVGAPGDLDGDGVGDLLVTVGDGTARGVRVLSGLTGVTLDELAQPTFYSAELYYPVGFGDTLGAAGDLDGDGVGDLLVGDPQGVGASSLGITGAVPVYSGVDGGWLFTVLGQREQELFGAALAGGVDVDADGVPDLAVGGPAFGLPFGERTGRAQLLSGVDGALLQEFRGTSADQGVGAAVALLAGPGAPRLAVGEPGTSHQGRLALRDDLLHAAGAAPRSLDFGALVPGELLHLSVDGGLPGAAVALVLGLSALQAPFKGGTLVPSPDLAVWTALDGTGDLRLELPWPPTAPPLEPLRVQFWIADPAGPLGFAATNGAASP